MLLEVGSLDLTRDDLESRFSGNVRKRYMSRDPENGGDTQKSRGGGKMTPPHKKKALERYDVDDSPPDQVMKYFNQAVFSIRSHSHPCRRV